LTDTWDGGEGILTIGGSGGPFLPQERKKVERIITGSKKIYPLNLISGNPTTGLRALLNV
jgi:hypothetical protein